MKSGKVLLFGNGGGEHLHHAPSNDTARIQDCHLTIEHVVCEALERPLFVE